MSEQNPKKTRQRSAIIAGAIFLATFVLLVMLQSSNLWKDFEIETASDSIVLYALSSLNFIALIVFGFIFLRLIVKLVRERRALVLGAKMRTRLWFYFFAISFLPIVAMAIFSYLFMNRAIDRWFSRIPENIVSAGRTIQKENTQAQSARLNDSARMLAHALATRERVSDSDLKDIAVAGNLAYISIIRQNGAEKSYVVPLNYERIDALNSVVELAKTGAGDNASLIDGIGFDAATAAINQTEKLIIVPDYFRERNVSLLIDDSLEQMDALKQQQVNVRLIGLLTLGVLTFLLIFASTWIAFYIARGFAVPLKALAEGADKIASGKIGHQVEVFAEDELELLRVSFNSMSARLAENSNQLAEGRRYIETVLETLSTGVVSFDFENRITTINKAAVDIFRFESDVRGAEISEFFRDENRAVLERLLNRARRIGQATDQTVLHRENADENAAVEDTLPVALAASSLPNKSGVVLVIEDLTELLAAQRATAWQEVARRMAHEIKNPLTPIQLSAERIAKRCAVENGEQTDTDQTKKVISEGTQTILREVSSLKAMVDEFSRFARLPNSRLESGGLNETIEQSAEMFEDRGVKILRELAENLPEILVDREQMRRVFVNLIENAVEAFDPAQENKEILVKSWVDNARDIVVAEVSDNASGITPAAFRKLFQPYFSTKGRGTGLGLAIVQRIVSDHRGKIKAVNNQPKGAKFIVELPLIT